MKNVTLLLSPELLVSNPFAPARRFAVAELWRFLVALFIDRFLPFFFWSLQHTISCLATLLPCPTRMELLIQSADSMGGRR
jgi:hypothetical protein